MIVVWAEGLYSELYVDVQQWDFVWNLGGPIMHPQKACDSLSSWLGPTQWRQKADNFNLWPEGLYSEIYLAVQH